MFRKREREAGIEKGALVGSERQKVGLEEGQAGLRRGDGRRDKSVGIRALQPLEESGGGEKERDGDEEEEQTVQPI